MKFDWSNLMDKTMEFNDQIMKEAKICKEDNTNWICVGMNNCKFQILTETISEERGEENSLNLIYQPQKDVLLSPVSCSSVSSE